MGEHGGFAVMMPANCEDLEYLPECTYREENLIGSPFLQESMRRLVPLEEEQKSRQAQEDRLSKFSKDADTTESKPGAHVKKDDGVDAPPWRFQNMDALGEMERNLLDSMSQDADNQMASDALAARKRRMRGLIHDLPSLNSIDDVTALASLDSGAWDIRSSGSGTGSGPGGASRFGFEISSADEASQVVKQSTMSQPADSSVAQRARSMWQPLPSTTAPGKEIVAAVPP